MNKINFALAAFTGIFARREHARELEISSGYDGMLTLVWSYSNAAILQHGCHCSEIGMGLDIFQHSISLDETDNICRHWLESRACLYKQLGSCEGYVQKDVSYPMNNGTCISDLDPCQKALCSVDMHMITRLNSVENYETIMPAGDVCEHPSSGGSVRGVSSNNNESSALTQNQKSVTDVCCGDTPNVFIHRSTSGRECPSRITSMSPEVLDSSKTSLVTADDQKRRFSELYSIVSEEYKSP